jgi:hypothetical protein
MVTNSAACTMLEASAGKPGRRSAARPVAAPGEKRSGGATGKSDARSSARSRRPARSASAALKNDVPAIGRSSPDAISRSTAWRGVRAARASSSALKTSAGKTSGIGGSNQGKSLASFAARIQAQSGAAWPRM